MCQFAHIFVIFSLILNGDHLRYTYQENSPRKIQKRCSVGGCWVAGSFSSAPKESTHYTRVERAGYYFGSNYDMIHLRNTIDILLPPHGVLSKFITANCTGAGAWIEINAKMHRLRVSLAKDLGVSLFDPPMHVPVAVAANAVFSRSNTLIAHQ